MLAGSGRQLADAARQRRPDLKVLFTWLHRGRAADAGTSSAQFMSRSDHPLETRQARKDCRMLLDG
jgi:hypothetical protein